MTKYIFVTGGVFSSLGTRILFFAILCLFNVFVFSTFSFAQNKDSSADYEDICHVYVVDAEKALKLQELLLKSENPEEDNNLIKLAKEGETEFSAFKTKFIEEELTTKHYPFPKSNLIITASVYYTDESMPVHPSDNISPNSMTIGISVTKKEEISSIRYPPINSAITEVSYDENTGLVRAKQYVSVKGKIYLVGLECDCAAKRQNKK